MADISRQARSSVPARPGVKRGSAAGGPGSYKGKPERPGGTGTRSRSAARARRRRSKLAVGAGLVVLAMVAALAIAYAGGGAGPPVATGASASGTYAVAPATLRPLENVPAAALKEAATSSPKAAQPPMALPLSAAALSSGGKPEVLYIGANYCPYCAAERWALLSALSKFGTFSALRGTASSETDGVNPGTPTVTFAGSVYRSSYLDFVAVETQGSVAGPDGKYPLLDKMSSAQSALFSKYDSSPYVPPGEAGGIPFLDLGGRYYFVGSQYDASHIAGWDFDRAAAYLATGSNPTSVAMRAAAGQLVDDMCRLTGAQPKTSCP